MIYVTLGTQKFQMDRLLQKLDLLIEKEIIKEQVIVQCVYHNYSPIHYKIESLIPKEKVDRFVQEASLVITHSGTGSLIKCNQYSKKTLIVPRLKKYKEHVDDHQCEIARVFQKKARASVVYEMDELEEYLKDPTKIMPLHLPLNNEDILKSIEANINNYLSMDCDGVVLVGSDLNDKGGITTVISNIYNTSLKDEFHMKFIPTYISNSTYQWILLYIISLFKILYFCLFEKNSIYHIHVSYKGSFYRKLIIVMLLKLFNKKVIMHFHGSESKIFYDNLSKGIKKGMRSLFFRNIDIAIVLSKSWKDYFSKFIDENKIEVLNNAVAIPEEENKDFEKLRILFLGRFGQRKGIYDLIDVLDDLSKNYNLDIEVALGGDGEIEKVNQLIQEKNLSNVKNLGWINSIDKIKLLKEANLFVLPSYNEGLPMAILEAMSYKCAVISTNVGGIPEVVKHNKNGFLIEAGDKESLKSYILSLEKEKNTLKSMGEYSYEIVKTYFSQDKMNNTLRKIYTQVRGD